MIRSRANNIIGILAILLLTACGQQYQAKNLVKDFVKVHATEELNITDFSTSIPRKSSATHCYRI